MKKNSVLKNISLTSYDDIFKTDEERNQINKTVTEISVAALCPFANHPFKLYQGERFSDMVESVKANGIIMPIIVRPVDSDTYEILSGHNRVEAAKAAGLETVPAIVRENLSDDEALLIVTETNLIQRSFSDLSHSERAAALSAHHEAVKSQGKRTDLINEIEMLLKNDEKLRNTGEKSTFSPVGKKLNNVVKLGEEYGLSKNSVARYLRINSLNEGLKSMVDDNTIALRAAVSLSYIPAAGQTLLFAILEDNPEFKVDIKKAGQLREFSEGGGLTREIIKDVLSGVALKKKARAPLPVQSLKIGGKLLSKYFGAEQKPSEIQAELFEALEFYREHKNK